MVRDIVQYMAHAFPATDVAAEMGSLAAELQGCDTCSKAWTAAVSMLAVRVSHPYRPLLFIAVPIPDPIFPPHFPSTSAPKSHDGSTRYRCKSNMTSEGGWNAENAVKEVYVHSIENEE